MKLTKIILFIIISVFLTNCVSTTLKPEDRAKIKSIYISDKLGSQLEYVRLGTTIFNNNTEQINDFGIFKKLSNDLSRQLKSKGYVISSNLSTSDLNLTIEPVRSYNYPSEMGVLGAGFFTHSMLGISSPILAQSAISFEGVDAKTGKKKFAAQVSLSEVTGVKTNKKRWSEINASDRNLLLNKLKSSVAEIPIKATTKVGL